jgi:ERCC4-type nuclease
MEAFEQAAMLDSMKILIDTREQATDRARKRYESFGVPYERRKLEYGDYTYTAQKPDGSWIIPDDDTINPLIVIERKMNLDELAACFTHERERFEREFERVKAHKAKIILLVEDATWENLLNGRYRSKFNPKAFAASISTYISRYGITLVFCKAETTGRLIHDLLYYDLRERILEGEYDS